MKKSGKPKDENEKREKEAKKKKEEKEEEEDGKEEKSPVLFISETVPFNDGRDNWLPYQGRTPR